MLVVDKVESFHMEILIMLAVDIFESDQVRMLNMVENFDVNRFDLVLSKEKAD